MTGLVFNFSAWLMKNVTISTEKIKLQSYQHFVENTTEILQHVVKMQ